MEGSTATTSQVPLTLASSISLARMIRPPTKLMSVAGEQVPGQQQLPLAPLESAQVDPSAVEEDPSRLECGHLADGHEQVSAADGHDQPDHRRVGRVPQPGDEVLHPPEAVPGPVHQGPSDDAREVDDLGVHSGHRLLRAHRRPA